MPKRAYIHARQHRAVRKPDKNGVLETMRPVGTYQDKQRAPRSRHGDHRHVSHSSLFFQPQTDGGPVFYRPQNRQDSPLGMKIVIVPLPPLKKRVTAGCALSCGCRTIPDDSCPRRCGPASENPPPTLLTLENAKMARLNRFKRHSGEKGPAPHKKKSRHPSGQRPIMTPSYYATRSE